MPFISKDWRSPGEEWVRYEGGWELKKTITLNQKSNEDLRSGDESDVCSQTEKRFENEESSQEKEVHSPSVRPKQRNQESQKSKDFHRLLEQLNMHRINQQGQGVNLNNQNHNNFNIMPNQENNENNLNLDNLVADRRRQHSGTVLLRLDRRTQPFCAITLKNTKEVAGFNELAEAMLKLDMIQAVRDIRRFNYVSKLMYLLFNHDKLSQLPGSAQKILFRMLEEMADTVYQTNQNQHVLQKLMEELQTTMTIYHVWGSHLGSSTLFKQHIESRRRITEFVERMQIEFKQDLAAPGLVNCLPEECIREILLRLSDSKDLESAGQSCSTMNNIAREKRVWRELVQTHFSEQQVEFALQNRPGLRDNRDWKQIYQHLRRQHGLRDDFTEVIMLCRKCSSLFWQSLGHPCFIPVAGQSDDDEFKSDKNWEPNPEGGVSNAGNNVWCIPLTPLAFLSFFSV